MKRNKGRTVLNRSPLIFELEDFDGVQVRSMIVKIESIIPNPVFTRDINFERKLDSNISLVTFEKLISNDADPVVALDNNFQRNLDSTLVLVRLKIEITNGTNFRAPNVHPVSFSHRAELPPYSWRIYRFFKLAGIYSMVEIPVLTYARI